MFGSIISGLLLLSLAMVAAMCIPGPLADQ